MRDDGEAAVVVEGFLDLKRWPPSSSIPHPSSLILRSSPAVVSPPSIASTSPVMYDESAFDAKKTNAGAICRAVRDVSSSILAVLPSLGCGLVATFSGVQTGPCATQFTGGPATDEVLRQRLGEGVDGTSGR